jgi:hypothetical protein
MDACFALEQCGQPPRRVRLARRQPPMASLSASYTRDGAIQIYDLAGRTKTVTVSAPAMHGSDTPGPDELDQIGVEASGTPHIGEVE